MRRAVGPRRTPPTLRDVVEFVRDWAHDCHEEEEFYGFRPIERMCQQALDRDAHQALRAAITDPKGKLQKSVPP